MNPNNGGPAFPQDSQVARTWAVFENAKRPLSEEDFVALIKLLQPGMTLRDYFAAKAMQGLISQSKGTALSSEPMLGTEYAYKMADAMLKAREL